jgi:2-oxoglutarate ferredoxin oxidoreductase subunit alpha
MGDASIVLAGAAGQGIETVADFLATVIKLSGYNVFATREVMSRIRGGTNSIQLRVSETEVGSYALKSDIIVALTKDSLPHLEKYGRVSNKSVIVGEKEVIATIKKPKDRLFTVPFNDLAQKAGGRIYANTVAAGALAQLFNVSDDIAHNFIQRNFGAKGEKVVQQNIVAYKKGKEYGKKLVEDNRIKFDIKSDENTIEKLLLSGTEAVAIGALAAGCNFVSSYPMSPSTGVLTFLARKAKKFGVVIDQAEDEIAAINKGLGAWYAGARAIVTTSGGGLALMTEGLSLSGMLENPIVIHLAQRPAPATGLPTRTEQGDLMFAINTAHGEFPRVIYAPGNPQDAFHLTVKAFDVADSFQIPVIILTDQYLLDSLFTSVPIDLEAAKYMKHFVKTDNEYKRYKFTKSGVSPRGIPGYGEGLIGVDSDEHDEEGHITEDLNLRVRMVDKRLHKKLEVLRKDSLEPELYGRDQYDTLVVAWGTNYYGVDEAIHRLGNEEVSMLYFKQVFPLNSATLDYLKKANTVLSLENNATGQFARLIELETGFRIPDENILLKYDGLPFPVEQIQGFIEEAWRR